MLPRGPFMPILASSAACSFPILELRDPAPALNVKPGAEENGAEGEPNGNAGAGPIAVTGAKAGMPNAGSAEAPNVVNDAAAAGLPNPNSAAEEVEETTAAGGGDGVVLPNTNSNGEEKAASATPASIFVSILAVSPPW